LVTNIAASVIEMGCRARREAEAGDEAEAGVAAEMDAAGWALAGAGAGVGADAEADTDAECPGEAATARDVIKEIRRCMVVR
jgi:hypothetical protein